ncbi:hypothetical protein LRAMOSA10056 [Lichtheimia ramosa]|uniref:Uncharacterized protein n=1 Tax=Lichtheimia ramosa TaxID=688394 RepID=A0A077WMV0_9FUNG|nr:hypothetical protein LRAMOSA10056 [Lichtheimia ramosa]
MPGSTQDLYASPCTSEGTLVASKSTCSTINDKTAIQLLTKLDEGLETLSNLRSILTLKTAELNELVAQLELTNQAIINVEQTTTQTEAILKDMGIIADDRLLMEAHASLDRAIKSASSLYKPQEQQDARQRMTTKARYKTNPKPLLRQLNSLLRELELDPNQFMERLDDIQSLKTTKVDLDIAKTIALAAKSNLKRRMILLKSTTRHSNHAEIAMLGEKIRKSVAMWKTYARDAPMLLDGKDILDILASQDDILTKDGPGRHRMSVDSSNGPLSSPRSCRDPLKHTRTASLHAGVPTTKTAIIKTDKSTIPSPKKIHRHPVKTKVNSTTRMRTTANTNKLTIITCPNPSPLPVSTSSSTAKLEPPTKSTSKSLIQRGPGSTLRLRSMLAKRAMAVA